MRAVAAVATGAARAVLLEGPTGIGKTEMLRTVIRSAEATGLTVLSARAGSLEREHGLGLARKLFEPILLGATDVGRASLLRGPAAGVRALLGIDEAVAGPARDELAAGHALFWLCAHLSEQAPVVLAIDDVQWADVRSIRWLAYLITRLRGAPDPGRARESDR